MSNLFGQNITERSRTHEASIAVFNHWCAGQSAWRFTAALAQPNFAKVKEYRIERSVPPEAQACIECHRATTPGVFADWAKSRHANANITCLDCHLVQPGDQDIAQDHEKYYSRSDMPWGEAKYKMPIASIVTPKDCSRCHPDEATQYSKSKHANTIEIMWKLDPWLNKGMNSDNERKTGCFNCHGTVITIDESGKIDPDTWPNAGVGRLNLDGSKGACTSCHTRHRFSVAEARRPEACDQCHLGPDHPQIEIYEESKHGTIYHAYQDEYNFDAAGGTWTAGRRLPRAHLRGLPHERIGQGAHQPRRHPATLLGDPGPADGPSPGFQTLSLRDRLEGRAPEDEKHLQLLPRRLLDQRFL